MKVGEEVGLAAAVSAVFVGVGNVTFYCAAIGQIGEITRRHILDCGSYGDACRFDNFDLHETREMEWMQSDGWTSLIFAVVH